MADVRRPRVVSEDVGVLRCDESEERKSEVQLGVVQGCVWWKARLGRARDGQGRSAHGTPRITPAEQPPAPPLALPSALPDFCNDAARLLLQCHIA